MALQRVITSKCMTTHHNASWLCRGFVSATSPSYKAAKVDKETCGKILETAETVKEGSKDVAREVKRVGEAITGKVANATGNMVADAAKRGFEHAAETAESKKGKDLCDTGKVAAEAVKEKVQKEDK